MARATGTAGASAAAVVVAGIPVIALHDLGPVSAHMAVHILLMNVIAPLVAAGVAHMRAPRRLLWPATIAQAVLLWGWHAPPVHHAAEHSTILQIAMHGSLFLAALMFWSSLFRLIGKAQWQAFPALLVTGKLVCLLGALMIFAPRFLYGGDGHATGSLADQQLAGLLMVTACPLSYLVAGVVLVARMLTDLERIPGPAHYGSFGP